MDRYEGMSRAQLNQLNRTFHQRIVEFSANPIFIGLHEKTQFHYWNLCLPVLFTKDQVRLTDEQHRKILDALASRREDAAEASAREHIETTHAIVQEAMDGFV